MQNILQFRGKKKREITIHILSWLVFWVLLIFIFSFPFHKENLMFRAFLYIIPLIALFYTNTIVLIPRLLARKKIIPYILAIIGAIVLIIYLYLGIQLLIDAEFYYRNRWVKGIVTGQAIMNSLLVLTVSGGLKMTREWFRNEQLKKEMESEKMISELALLKSQINPHSLFNNLNSIYSLTIKKSDDAPKAVVKLSEMMRYMLYDSTAEQISLSKEVEHLQNYIDLQKLRINRKTKINFETQGDIETKTIEPMLLEPFVENAFKHGDVFLENSQIDICLKVAGNVLYFNVGNTISRNNHVKHEHSGIGLKNIEKRLALLYPERYCLQIDRTPDKFMVSLKLKLSDD